MKNTVYTAGNQGLTHLRYYEGDTPRAILQNVEIIMSTPKGTVPLCMDFGTDQSYIDYPRSEAVVRMIAPIREAIEEWEPRAAVKQVTNDDREGAEQLIPRAEVILNGT